MRESRLDLEEGTGKDKILFRNHKLLNACICVDGGGEGGGHNMKGIKKNDGILLD